MFLEIVMKRHWLTRIWITVVAAVAVYGHTQTQAQTVNVVEYRNKTLDAYFITGRASEQAALDAVADFSRTGMSFQAVSAATSAAALTKVCRFYVSLASPFVSSHFYGRQGSDCEAALAANPPGFTYEGYDFAVQSPTAGSCPVGTFAVSRSFRALGTGKTSNHRYTVSAATYAIAATAGYVGEGVTFCATAATHAASGPSATAVGVATGSAVTATIGAAGGSLRSADGKLTLTVPAGALAANTTIGMQPISNFAHGRIGDAYRLTPDGQTFAQPVTLTFGYTEDELIGGSADVLGVASQTATGFWLWAGEPTVNAATKTFSVNTTHFSDWSRVRGIQMRPPSKTVRVKGSVSLVVTVCYQVSITGPSGDPLTSLGYNCDLNDELAILNPVSDWSVNGVMGGGSVTGTVSGSGTAGTFVAPATKPNPNTVTVSALVKKSPLGQKVLVTSNITITEDSWTGTGKSTSDAIDASAEVIWTLESNDNNVATYRPSGTASVVVHGCIVYSPSIGVIDPATGVLVVDFNANPPTYHGTGLTVWPAVQTVTCANPPPPISTFVPAVFFGGSKGALGVEAAGEVSADGKTIGGTDINTQSAAVRFTWSFTRD